MRTAPTLHTERLILRSFTLEDAQDVQRLASDPDVASTTDAIEYPYEDGMAEEWIQWYHKCFEDGERVNFAITLKTDGMFVGTGELVLRIHLPYNDAALGYWIGKPYWNCGYATEAAKAMVAYGFREHDLDLIYADYFKRNSASGRVMQKIGMRYAYDLPKDPEDDSSEDMVRHKILKSEFVE